MNPTQLGSFVETIENLLDSIGTENAKGRVQGFLNSINKMSIEYPLPNNWA